LIDNALGQGIFGTHDRQSDALLADKAGQLVEFTNIQGHVLTILGRAGIAGSAVDARGPVGASQLPDQGMLSASLAYHQDLHAAGSSA